MCQGNSGRAAGGQRGTFGEGSGKVRGRFGEPSGEPAPDPPVGILYGSLIILPLEPFSELATRECLYFIWKYVKMCSS